MRSGHSILLVGNNYKHGEDADFLLSVLQM